MEWNGRYISIEEQCTYIFVANVLSGRQQVRPELGYSLFTLPPSSHPPFTFPAGTVEKCSPEILSLVFEHLVDYYAPEWDQPPTGHLYRWLPILWVCRYWRATAIATPRLFRYIDFLQLPDAAIVFFLRHSKGVDTSLWFNFDHSQDLQSALALKPGLLSHTSYVSFESAISPQERPHWLAATNLSRLYLRDRGVALIFDNPRISAFSRLRNRCVDSAIPGSMWHSGMFPDTLTELKIGLLQLPFYDDDTIPMDNARDDVSADHIISALASLSVLERLDLFIDPLSDSPPQQATRLPLHRLQSVNLFLPFIGYSHIMPFMPTSSYDLSVRFCQFMHRPEPDTYTISPFLDFVKRRHTYFRQVDIDVTSANIRITLHDTDGATMAVEANRDHDKILRDILEAVGPTYIKGVIIRDRVREEVPVDLTLRYRAILQVLRLLEHVTDLAIAGGLGPMARDLLVAVGGPPARLLFDTWDVPLLYWPDLQAIRLNSVRGDAVWGVVMGTTIGFIGLALMAINTPRQRVSVVRLADTAFTEQQVRPWTHWVPTIVVEGISFSYFITYITILIPFRYFRQRV